MTFKDLIMGDIETKHLNMINETTPAPFSLNVSLISSKNYSNSRDKYQRRLNSEMQQYNSALYTIKRAYDTRIEKESNLKVAIKRDVKVYLPCLFIFLLAIIGLFFYVQYAVKSGIAYWVRDSIIKETGFDCFFALFEQYHNNTGVEVCITAVALAGCLWLGLLIFGIVRRDDYGWLISVLLGGLFLAGISIALPFLAIRLLFVGLGYVAYYILTPYGVIFLGVLAVIIMIIIGRHVKLIRFKTLLAFTIIFAISCASGLWYMSVGINKQAKEYYEAHNGESFETAKELSFGKSNTILLYDIDDSFYFIFTPNESGEYKISSDDGESISVYLWSANYNLIKSDTDNDIDLVRSMNEGETYYLQVKAKESYRGHYKVLCSKL